MDATAPIRILVVEDDSDTRTNLRDILELDDHRVDLAGTVAEALGRDDWSYDAIILDRKLPDGTAAELLPRLKRVAPGAAVIVVTGYADLQGAIAALRQGAADYILKPLNPDALRASLARVADRRALERAKERSEATFRRLVESAECLIVITRPDGAILYFSPFAERLTGYAAREVLGRSFPERFVPEPFRAAAEEAARRVAAGRPIRGLESQVACRDGSCRWVLWNGQALEDYEGGPALLAVGQDITDRKHAQERALQSERLAAIGQMVAGLAHESRNALQRSQACLEMLALHVQDRPEALGLIDRLQTAQDHLHHLYEDVRGYAAPIRLERRACDVAEVCRQAWAHLEGQRKGREARLVERAAADATCEVDPFRLEQVFRNVLENALAACPDPVEITLRLDPARIDGAPALRVGLRDNGPGLGPEPRRRLFEPFFTTKTKGTGLGMAIARRIVEAHGGTIAVGDGPSQGAEILITLPRESR